MKRFIPFILFSLAILFLSLLLARDHNQQPHTRPMPELVLTSLDGKNHWVQSDLNGKVTVINFFASWCSPCAAEMPELMKFQKQYSDVVVYGVAWNDEPKTVSQWLKKNGNPFRTVWIDAQGDATMALGLKGVPETIVIDASGMVRYQLSGPLTKQIRNELFDPLIHELQKEAAKGSDSAH